MFHKDYVAAHESVTINGKLAQSAADCDLVLHVIELKEARRKCAAYWGELLGEPRRSEVPGTGRGLSRTHRPQLGPSHPEISELVSAGLCAAA